MYETYYNASERIWTGPTDEFEFDRSRNFGEAILEKLNDDKSEQVIQVNHVCKILL